MNEDRTPKCGQMNAAGENTNPTPSAVPFFYLDFDEAQATAEETIGRELTAEEMELVKSRFASVICELGLWNTLGQVIKEETED